MTKAKPPQMPKDYGQPESLKKALGSASTEKQRIHALETASALAASTKKPLKVKVKHG